MLRISVRTPSAFVCLPAISHFSITLSEKMPQSSKHTAGIEGDRERSAVNHQTFHWGSFSFQKTGLQVSVFLGYLELHFPKKKMPPILTALLCGHQKWPRFIITM